MFHLVMFFLFFPYTSHFCRSNYLLSEMKSQLIMLKIFVDLCCPCFSPHKFIQFFADIIAILHDKLSKLSDVFSNFSHVFPGNSGVVHLFGEPLSFDTWQAQFDKKHPMPPVIWPFCFNGKSWDEVLKHENGVSVSPIYTAWWFGTWLLWFHSVGKNHPIWLS